MCREFDQECGHDSRTARSPGHGGRWSRPGILIAGLAAVLWLLFRSGSKPSRLSYPCQQTALASATAAFGIPLVMLLLALRRKASTPQGAAAVLLVAGLVVAASLAGFAAASWDDAYGASRVAPPEDYSPAVYVVSDVRGIAPGRFGGVDDLITLMGVSGRKWYRTDTPSLIGGADGIVARDSVVLLKINAQWAERGGTNTDLLRGVIRGIVEHPDGFVGEVVVADNGQGYGDLNRTQNNAEDHSQSTLDVVGDFATEGWRVSARLWDGIRFVSVGECTDGDFADGYVVNAAYDAQTQVKVSYPKFRTAFGTIVSYKFGVWESLRQDYDSDRLVVINMPVLKTHSIYAVTSAVKNHMGVVTNSQSTSSHAAVARGGLGSLLAEVRMPDLTILDCIWVLARPGRGPSASYDQVTRTNTIMASTDPVALDIWAVKNLLMPEIIANGYQPSDYHNTQSPDNAASTFRQYLDRSMNEILLAGIDVTNNPQSITVHRWGGDADFDGDVDADDIQYHPNCMDGPNTSLAVGCDVFDFDGDADVDLDDAADLQRVYTDSLN